MSLKLMRRYRLQLVSLFSVCMGVGIGCQARKFNEATAKSSPQTNTATEIRGLPANDWFLECKRNTQSMPGVKFYRVDARLRTTAKSQGAGGKAELSLDGKVVIQSSLQNTIGEASSTTSSPSSASQVIKVGNEGTKLILSLKDGNHIDIETDATKIVKLSYDEKAYPASMSFSGDNVASGLTCRIFEATSDLASPQWVTQVSGD